MEPAQLTTGEERPKVLVVDDEAGPRESIALILATAYEVTTAASGEEALIILEREAIDVVTLDLRMPGLSGEQTLARIRKLDPDVEVVIITGYGSYESAVEVLRLRAFDYLGKPFRSEQLLDIVGRAVDARHRKAAEPCLDEILPPLGEIMGEVDRLSRQTAHGLSDLDRMAFERILGRLNQFHSRLNERFGPRASQPLEKRRRGA